MKSAMRPICRFVAQLSGLKVEGAITQRRSAAENTEELFVVPIKHTPTSDYINIVPLPT